MAGIIRHRVPVQTIPLSFADLEEEADRLIADARRKAAADSQGSIRAAAAEIAKRREEGYAAGLEAGRAAGLQEIRGKAETIIQSELESERNNLRLLQDAYQAAIGHFETQRHRLHAEAERGLIQLAVAIARRVCELHVQQNEDAAAPLARRLIDIARHAGDVELRVNPVEFRALADVGRQTASPGVDQRHIHVIADDAVARGGCVLRSPDTSIDASIEVQIGRIANALLGGRSAAGADEQAAPTIEADDRATQIENSQPAAAITAAAADAEAADAGDANADVADANADDAHTGGPDPRNGEEAE